MLVNSLCSFSHLGIDLCGQAVLDVDPVEVGLGLAVEDHGVDGLGGGQLSDGHTRVDRLVIVLP